MATECLHGMQGLQSACRVPAWLQNACMACKGCRVPAWGRCLRMPGSRYTAHEIPGQIPGDTSPSAAALPAPVPMSCRAKCVDGRTCTPAQHVRGVRALMLLHTCTCDGTCAGPADCSGAGHAVRRPRGDAGCHPRRHPLHTCRSMKRKADAWAKAHLYHAS